MIANSVNIAVIPQGQDRATILIDGYTITATFAEAKNNQAYIQIKKILLSACPSSLTNKESTNWTS
jgi:hypothetical protein